jgi:hypothetical protein
LTCHKDDLVPLIRRLDAMTHHCRDLRRICSAALDVNTGLKALLFAEYPRSQIFPQIENP